MNIGIQSKYLKLGVSAILLVLFVGCASTRRGTNNYLLVKNSIECNDDNVDTDELWPYIKQKPNRKLFGLFRFHSSVYIMASKWKDNKTSYWLKNTVGEEPVHIDTMQTNRTIDQFEIYLASKGYFDSEVTKKIKYKKWRRKAKVTYIIDANSPYTLRNISYSIRDGNLRSFIYADTINSLLKRGNNFDVDVMDDERERIAANLKNDGFYGFAKEFIQYGADSSVGNKQIDIQLILSKIQRRSPYNKDSIITLNHKRYKIDSIFVFPDFNNQGSSVSKQDTFVYQPFEDDTTYKYYFVSSNKELRIKPKILAQSIFYKPGEYYQLRDVNRSYRRMSDLKVFRSTNIQFNPQEDSLSAFNSKINSSVQLTRTPINAINVELEGTNSAGDLGIATNLIMQNKNTFRGAEILNLRLNGAMEVQHVIGSEEDENIFEGLPFNTVETGVNLGITIPQFLLPVRTERFAKRNLPFTEINTGFNYQKRPDYERTIGNVSFGYSWRESSTKRHTLNPFIFSSVKISKDSSFQEKLSSIKDERLLRSYTDHLTTATSYTFMYNNQKVNKVADFMYFKFNIESAGSINSLKNDLINAPKSEEGYYTLFGIRYAQYLRTDFDIRYYRVFNPSNTLVTRFVTGVGYAYGNSEIMPFEKSFYAGGANGIRAWKIRSLGPGSYSDENNFDKTGDIHLEANIEYRYKIYSFVHGATFIDAGNVWLMRQSSAYPGGVFRFDMFLPDIAVGGGMGLRLDFSFFIFRFDAAIPIRNPKEEVNERWIDDKTKLKDINYNIGIGYPF